MRKIPTCISVAVCLFLLSPAARAADSLTVFAAASLTDAMEEIVDSHRRETGDAVRLSVASSSTLARQIEAGAPADIFVSANERWMDYLEDRQLIASGTRLSPVRNRLVIVATGGFGTPPGQPSDVLASLQPGQHLAIGDPDHVPAGIYARDALRTLGLWSSLESRLARADNVRAALALVARGEAPLGIVYATDAAIAPDVAIIATFPADSHAPIRYPFAITRGNDDARSRALLARLTGDAAMQVYIKYGFIPDGAP
jgi:molybdate transport system substrate-binding protein